MIAYQPLGAVPDRSMRRLASAALLALALAAPRVVAARPLLLVDPLVLGLGAPDRPLSLVDPLVLGLGAAASASAATAGGGQVPVTPPRRRTAPPDTGPWAPGPTTAPAKVEHPKVDGEALMEAASGGQGVFWTLQLALLKRSFGSEQGYYGAGVRAGFKALGQNSDGFPMAFVGTLGMRLYEDGLVEIPMTLTLRWNLLLFYAGIGGGWVTIGGEGPNDAQRVRWVGHPLVAAEVGINWPGSWEMGIQISHEFRTHKADGDDVGHTVFFFGLDF